MAGKAERFAVGDIVHWGFYAGGCHRERSGTVICVVPADRRPFIFDGDKYVLPDGRRIPSARTQYGGGLPRAKESYVIKVLEGGRAKYFWPITNKLTRAERSITVKDCRCGGGKCGDGVPND